MQELDNLTHVVEVRESKLVQLSKENVDLQETATILRRFVLTITVSYLDTLGLIRGNYLITAVCCSSDVKVMLCGKLFMLTGLFEGVDVLFCAMLMTSSL